MGPVSTFWPSRHVMVVGGGGSHFLHITANVYAWICQSLTRFKLLLAEWQSISGRCFLPDNSFSNRLPLQTPKGELLWRVSSVRFHSNELRQDVVLPFDLDKAFDFGTKWNCNSFFFLFTSSAGPACSVAGSALHNSDFCYVSPSGGIHNKNLPPKY